MRSDTASFCFFLEGDRKLYPSCSRRGRGEGSEKGTSCVCGSASAPIKDLAHCGLLKAQEGGGTRKRVPCQIDAAPPRLLMTVV